jgi:hypothetical protein
MIERWNLPLLRLLTSYCIFLLPSLPAYAQTEACGAAPSFAVAKEEAEAVKGDLNGKAQALSKYLGTAELGGRIEKERKTIYQTSEGSEAVRKDAYLAYLFCMIVMGDKNASMADKLDALTKFRTPAPAVPGKSSKRGDQIDFVDRLNANTPVEKLKEVFGAPIAQVNSKNKNQLMQFEGDSFDLFLVRSSAGDTSGFGVLGKDETSNDVEVPFLGALGEQTLGSLQSVCHGKIEAVDARYVFILTPPCYFGHPGNYLWYQFAFKPSDDTVPCYATEDLWKLEGRQFESLSCEGYKKLKPYFAFVYTNENAVKIQLAHAVLNYNYWQTFNNKF